MNDERPKASAEQSGGAAERLVHRLLPRALRDDVVPEAASCLDAETVAAWMDGALAADLRAAAEGHAAGCARCQAVLSAMARTEPPVAPRSWWPASLGIRWLVPAAAAATAVALWIAVSPPDDRSGTTALSTEKNRMARTQPSMAPPPAESPGSTPPAAVQAGEQAASAADNRVKPKELAKSVAEGMDRLEARRDRAETGKVADESSAAPVKQEAVLAPSVAATPPPPPPPAAPVRPAEALAGDAAARAAVPERLGGIASFKAAGPPPLTEIVSPDPAVRWRAGAGVVQRSTDGGVTWTVQQTGSKADFFAGSSPARNVAWLVGRGGIVLLSIDGTTWQQRPFPETIDLVAVTATDAKTASVTTSDGRRFSTTDGGAKWF